jgi:hypothetical protein
MEGQERDAYDTIICLNMESPVFWDGVTSKEEDIYGLADGI